MGMGVLDIIDPADYPPARVTCPRCGTVAEQRFAGPCATCVADLRATVRGEARAADDAYDPKMNVTPNAVALKDD
jgi:hypothetical protein